jgi:hypothetical protein
MDANPSKVVMFRRTGNMPVVPPPRSLGANPNVRPNSRSDHPDRVAACRFADNRLPTTAEEGNPGRLWRVVCKMEEAMDENRVEGIPPQSWR